MKPMKLTWMIVADEAIVRVLRWNAAGDALEPVEELTDADAHALGSEMRRDAQGRRAAGPTLGNGSVTGQAVQRSGTGGVSTTTSAGEKPQHQEAGRFAKRVARRLEAALNERGYEQLQLVASPRFLGLLRKELAPRVASCVADSQAHDLIHFDNAEIARRVPPPGRGSAGGT